MGKKEIMIKLFQSIRSMMGMNRISGVDLGKHLPMDSMGENALAFSIPYPLAPPGLQQTFLPCSWLLYLPWSLEPSSAE